jgi:hypothetical protein
MQSGAKSAASYTSLLLSLICVWTSRRAVMILQCPFGVFFESWSTFVQDKQDV